MSLHVPHTCILSLNASQEFCTTTVRINYVNRKEFCLNPRKGELKEISFIISSVKVKHGRCSCWEWWDNVIVWGQGVKVGEEWEVGFCQWCKNSQDPGKRVGEGGSLGLCQHSICARTLGVSGGHGSHRPNCGKIKTRFNCHCLQIKSTVRKKAGKDLNTCS